MTTNHVCKFLALAAGALLAASPSLAQPAADVQDVTGLAGKPIKPVKPKGVADSLQASWGNDYYECGGGTLESAPTLNGQPLDMYMLRKGPDKAKCMKGDQIVALAQPGSPGRNDDTRTIVSSMSVKVPPKHWISYSCGSKAALAVVKNTPAEFHGTPLAAWKVENGKFVPVADLKRVRCRNEGYGV